MSASARSTPIPMRPRTVRSECTNVSSGMAANTSANGRMKPMPICAIVVIHRCAFTSAPVLSLRSSALVASSSCNSTSRMYARPASILAISSRIANVIPIMRTRILSDRAPITGNSRVMRNDSMRNRPMEISTMMMTSAAISAVRNTPMKVAPRARPLAARLAVVGHRFGVRLDHRFVNVGEDVGAGIARIELGDDLDRLRPTRRLWRHFHRFLLILLDADDRFTQAAVHVRIVRQILARGIRNARKLAFHHSLLGVASGIEQHLAIACGETFLSVRDRMRGQAKPARQRARDRVDRLVSGVPRQVQRGYQQHQQDCCRQYWPGRDRQ